MYFMELIFSDRLLASQQQSCLNNINLVAKTIRDIEIISALSAGDFEVGQGIKYTGQILRIAVG